MSVPHFSSSPHVIVSLATVIHSIPCSSCSRYALNNERSALLAPLGLRLNARKCQLTCFHTAGLLHERDVAALEAFRAADVRINTSALKVLGCVVGVSDAAIAHELEIRPFFRADQQAAFRRLPLLSKQTRHPALSQLTGAVLTNRLCAMSPAATEVHAARYDHEVLRAAHSLVGICEADGDRYDEQLRLPGRLSGFDLVSAVRIAPAAYLAGAECTLRLSPVFSAAWSGEDALEAAWPMTVAIEDSIRRVSAAEAEYTARCPPADVAGVGPSVLPQRAAAFVEYFKANPPGSIQSAVIHRITTLSHIARMAAAGDGGVQVVADVARLQALKEKESSRWLHVLPTDSQRRLTDLQWQTAAQMRLGMPKALHGAAGGFCRHEEAARTDGAWHALVCNDRAGAAITRRHNAVVRLLADAAEMLKVPARVEPHQLCEDDALRPDIQLDLPDYTLLGDVTVNHPNALSWRKKAAKRGVAAVGDERAKQKDDKYAAMAKVVDAEFSAFVLYTYGGFHSSALSFIDKLAAGCDPAVALVPLADWKDDLKDRIAVCVQRHTADIVIDDARRARMASIPVRGRAAGGPSGRPRPSALAALSRRQREAVGRLCAEGGRAASLCAGLLVSLSPSSGPSEDVSPMSVDSDAPTEPRSASPVPSVSFVPETVMTESVEAASCVPATPGMDGASPDVSGTGGGVMPE